MKKFFKKIAFVSAMAMVVSAMPAQSATAAEGPQMYKTLKFYLGGDVTGSYSDEAKYAKVWDWKDDYVSVAFESDNEAVATVTAKKGLVTPVGVGTANVTATFTDEDGDTVKKNCVVTVKNNASDVMIHEKHQAALKELEIGDELQLVTLRLDGQTDTWVRSGRDVVTDGARFTSSDESVFTVGKTKGKVQAVGAGSATLSVWCVQSEKATWNAEKTEVVEYKATTQVKEYPVVVKAPSVVFDRATLTADDNVVTADGKDGTIITFTLFEKAGLIDTSSKDVQVRLSTTRGTLGFTNITLENGVAQVLFTSPILATTQTAKITAVIIGAGEDDQELINIEAAPIEIVCKPAEKQDDTSEITGAKVLDTTVESADRIILKFNKTVTAEDFMYLNNGAYQMTDPKTGAYKFSLTVDDNINQVVNSVQEVDFDQTEICNVMQYGDNGIVLVLSDAAASISGRNCMTDNSRYALDFTDKRYNIQVPTADKIGYVTDSSAPAVLSVNQRYNNSLTEVVITLSKPIPTTELDNTKVLIDGIPLLDFNVWGTTAGGNATVTRDSSVATKGRNVYIVTLGKYADGTQVYFKSGSHSLTVQNVGDYAKVTDAQNWIATSTLDFYINANTTAPDYGVSVQSPEQFLVEYNCLVNAPTALSLQYWNDTNKAWQDVSTLGTGQSINMKDVTYTASYSKVLIEVEKDWTTVLAGTNTNYYNYRFRVYQAKDAVYNVTNGLKNVEKTDKELLDNKMKVVDSTCPEILNIKESTAATAFTVTMSEPVQVESAFGSGVNFKGHELTPSTMQNGAIPVVTAQIVETNNLANTYAASITNTNDFDTEITVSVATALTAGKTYTLYVRSVSDDIGNTSNTLSINFTLAGEKAPEATKFQIAGVWADKDFQNDGVYVLDNTDATGNADAIYVEFTTPIATYGGVKSVLTNTNWSINGYALPQGAYIIGQVIGENRINGVTIVLPDGTINDVNATVVAVSSAVEDKDGQTLSGETRVVTQFPYSYTSELDSVAVFGWDTVNSALKKADYIGDLGRFVAMSTQVEADVAASATSNTLTITALDKFNADNVKEVKVTLTVTDNTGKTVSESKTYATTAAAVTAETYTLTGIGTIDDTKTVIVIDVIPQSGCVGATYTLKN